MFASVCCASDEFTFNVKSNYFPPPLELSCSNLFKKKPLNEIKSNSENERANVCASERAINKPLTFIFLLCLSLTLIRVEFDSFALGKRVGLAKSRAPKQKLPKKLLLAQPSKLFSPPEIADDSLF